MLAVIVLSTSTRSAPSGRRSLSYLNNTAPDKLGLPGGVPPSINFIASLLTGSVLAARCCIGVGFILWALMGTPLSDAAGHPLHARLVAGPHGPRQLGEVNDRFHTPVKAILLCAVTGEIALIALIQIPQASLLGALLAQIAGVHRGEHRRHRVPLPAARPSGRAAAAAGSAASRP